MKISICVVLIAAFFGGCSYLNQHFGLEDDHFLEECTEDVIEHQTGLKIDLSPDSQED